MRKTTLILLQGRVLALKPIPMALAFKMAQIGMKRGQDPTPEQLRGAMPIMREVVLSCLPDVAGIYEGTFSDFMEENGVNTQDVLDQVVAENPDLSDLDQLGAMVDQRIESLLPSTKNMIFVGDMDFEVMSEVIGKASKSVPV